MAYCKIHKIETRNCLQCKIDDLSKEVLEQKILIAYLEEYNTFLIGGYTDIEFAKIAAEYAEDIRTHKPCGYEKLLIKNEKLRETLQMALDELTDSTHEDG
jgi:hypothetical protein